MSTTTINFEFKVNGVYTDPTSVVLSDPTGTYGVKRTDTDAVVVADGTAMALQATGIYQYTLTDPDVDLTYNYYVEVVYDGATYYQEYNLSSTEAEATSITLAAVNEMLEIIGDAPATALNTDGTGTVGQAETILDRVSTRIQAEGWAANTLLCQEYEPNEADHIVLGANVLSVTPTYSSQALRVTIRSGELYDRLEATLEFDTSVYLDVIEEINLEYLSENLRAYIIAVAAQELAVFKKRGEVTDQFAVRKAAEARVAALQEDGDHRAINVLETHEARRIRGNRYTSVLYELVLD